MIYRNCSILIRSNKRGYDVYVRIPHTQAGQGNWVGKFQNKKVAILAGKQYIEDRSDFERIVTDFFSTPMRVS